MNKEGNVSYTDARFIQNNPIESLFLRIKNKFSVWAGKREVNPRTGHEDPEGE